MEIGTSSPNLGPSLRFSQWQPQFFFNGRMTRSPPGYPGKTKASPAHLRFCAIEVVVLSQPIQPAICHTIDTRLSQEKLKV
jgi:hypothetical protein